MNLRHLIRIFIGIVLVLVLFFVVRAVLRQQEAEARHLLVREEIEQALLGRKDYSDALRLAADAIQVYPEDWQLYLMQARAFHGRGREADALKALDRTEALTQDPDVQADIKFFRARSRMSRFVDTGDRDDFNLAEGVLRQAALGGRHSAAANILLGMALARASRFQDLSQARKLIEEGLAESSEPEGIVDMERVRGVLVRLKKG
jgi:tetratricopeptide (TPR) repeat protein